MSVGGSGKEIKIPELEREAEKYSLVTYWTEDEIQILKKYYGRVPTQKLASFLNRSYEATKCKAKALGIKAKAITLHNTANSISDKETVCVRVSPEVWKMAKRYAVEIDVTIGQLVEAALIHEMRGKHGLSRDESRSSLKTQR